MKELLNGFGKGLGVMLGITVYTGVIWFAGIVTGMALESTDSSEEE